MDVTLHLNSDGTVTWSAPAPAPAPAPTPTPSTSSVPLPGGVSKLTFSDYFPSSQIDATKWYPGMRDGYGPWVPSPLSLPNTAVSPPNGNNAEYMAPSQLACGSNGLTLFAVKDLAHSGYTWRSGCISSLNPIWAGGCLRVVAKMPQGNGMWPGIWALIGKSLSEFDIQEGGYSKSGVQTSRLLAVNLHAAGDTQQLVDSGIDLTADFHTYDALYIPGKSITTYIDGKQVAQFTSSVPTGAYSVIINLQVAGNATSGWHTVVDASTPNPSTMLVKSVEVFA